MDDFVRAETAPRHAATHRYPQMHLLVIFIGGSSGQRGEAYRRCWQSGKFTLEYSMIDMSKYQVDGLGTIISLTAEEYGCIP